MNADPEDSRAPTVAGDSPWQLTPTSRKAVPDLVGDHIVELVRSGRLQPGERLPTEPELGRMLGVARSSVRTALQRLQVQGVVEVNRGRGWFVSSEPLRTASDVMRDQMAGRDFDLLDVMEVRIALEGTAVALAAERAGRGQIDEILKLSQAHKDAPHDDPAVLLQSDQEFHEAIVEAAGNSYLSAIYSMVTPLVAEWRARSFTSPQVHARSATDHDQIAFQLRRRDEVSARIAMTSHLLGQYRAVTAHQRDAGGGSGWSPNLTTFLDDDKDEPRGRTET